MPPKSRKKLKVRTKENMLVTRLMAISFVVDDYIYKNKPITLLEAMKFDEEITSLKLKCKQDMRSLQVVEKLKIFMKSIIKEQSINSCVDYNPLIAINEFSNIENNNTDTLQTNTATELFGNRENQNTDLDNISQDNNMQKKISINMISELNVTNTKTTQVGSTEINTLNSVLKLNNKSEKSICTSNNINFDVFCINPTNKKELAKPDLTPNLQKPPEQEETFLVQENQKPIKIPTEINNIEKQTKNNQKTNNKIIAKNSKTKTKKNINKEIENKSSGENKPRKKAKEKTQVNFSWVENLKYVREVSPDEHTDLHIDNNFWTNLSLPGIWNPNEFD